MMFFFEIWKVSYIHLGDLQCLAHVGLREMLGYFPTSVAIDTSRRRPCTRSVMERQLVLPF